jgi:hypothetical protein
MKITQFHIILDSALVVVFNIYFIISIAVLHRFRNEEAVAKRLPYTIYTLAIACQIVFNGALVTLSPFDAVRLTYFPCYSVMVIFYIGFPMYCYSYILRVVQFVEAFNLAQGFRTTPNIWEEPFYFFVLRHRRLDSSVKSSSNLTNVQRVGMRSFFKYLIIIEAVFISLMVLMIIVVPDSQKILPTCPLSSNMILFAMLLLFILVIPYLLYIMRNFKDTLGVMKEIRFDLIMFVIAYFVNMGCLLFRNNYLTVYIGSNTGLTIAVLSTHATNIWYPIYLTIKSKRLKMRLVCDEESFLNSLMDENLFGQLKEIAARGLASENILFFEKYREIVKKYDIRRTFLNRELFKDSLIVSEPYNKADFMAIYDQFIRRSSAYELNIDHTICKVIACEIDKKTFDLRVYERVMEEVLKMLYLNTFPNLVKETMSLQQ